MLEIKERHLETDVLVIGAGGAGLRAAIEAKNIGSEVTVVSKGDLYSGCTAIAMGGMSAAIEKKDNPDCHFEDTIRGGSYLNNQKLVNLLVKHAVERVKDLERYGTSFEKDGNSYKLFPYTGNSIPRGVSAIDPYQGGYINGLINEVKRLGINILNNVMIIDLFKEKNVIVGAAGLDLEGEILLIINAKAVILATGGGGNLYHLTTNPLFITGDGYALAYKVGAQLQDMEFVQSRVCMIYPKLMRGMPPPGDGLVTLGGRFYNGICERYMKKYFPEKIEFVTRDQMSICAHKEILAGRHTPHGGVFGDLSGVPKEELCRFNSFIKACDREDFDPTWQPYEWAPGVHHFMGGVVINEKCETGIQGLFAAGEVASGIHGANRLAGNALTETQVFGTIAGKNAGKRALTIVSPSPSLNKINLVKNHLAEILKRDKVVDPLEVKVELTEIMSNYVGVVRNKDGLQKASQLLDTVKEKKIGKMSLTGERSFKMVANILEVENLLIIGRLVTLAAMMRTETRGAHNREDYPELDENWSKNIILQSENERTLVKTKPVIRIDD